MSVRKRIFCEWKQKESVITMKRKVFILTLACLIVFAMMPVYAFGATKIVPTQETRYTKSDGVWEKAQEITYTYNKKGLETKMVNQIFGEYDYGKYTYKTSYDSKNRVKQTIHINKYKSYTADYYKDVYTYTTKNRIKKIQHYYKEGKNASYKKNGYTVYTYSTTKKQNTIKRYDSDGKVIEKTVNLLNSKNRVKTSKYYYRSGSKLSLYSTTTYTYYTNGKVKEEVYDSEYATKIYTYTEKGRLKTEIYDNADGDYDETTYYYDTYGRLKKEITEGEYISDGDDDEDDNTYSNKTTYTYSGYYKKHKYPKKRFAYWNDEKKAYEKMEYSYKTVG